MHTLEKEVGLSRSNASFFSFGIRILKDTCIPVAFSAKKKASSGRFGLYKGEAGDYPTVPVTRWVP